jgi:hypothetical protein
MNERSRRGDPMATTGKRHTPRVDCALNGYIIDLDQYSPNESVDVFISAEVADISEQGLRIKTSVDIPTGTFLCFLIMHEGRKSLCFCQVRWRRFNKPFYWYGLYFREWSHLDPALAAMFSKSRLFKDLFKLREWFKKSNDLRKDRAAAA